MSEVQPEKGQGLQRGMSGEEPRSSGSEQRPSTGGPKGSGGPKTSKRASSGQGGSLAAASVATSTGNESFWKSFCSMAVYFPKFVCINNARLTLLYYFLTILLILGIAWYFIVNSQYNIEKTPFSMVHLCLGDGKQCRMSMSEMATNFAADANLDVCKNYANYQYQGSSAKFAPSGCMRMCGSQTSQNPMASNEPCMFPEDTVLLQPNMAFVPTYVTETTYKVPPNIAAFNANGACQTGYTKSQDMCKRQVAKFVPGAGKVKVKFAHEFAVSPEMAAFVISKVDKRSLSSSSSSQPSDVAGMKTVMFSFDGTKMNEWPAGAWIDPTIDDLLAAADYDDVGPSGALNLDQIYSRIDYGVIKNTMTNPPKEEVVLRMTGATVTIDVYITDKGTCHYARLEQDFEVGDSGQPVACMFVNAERTWTHDGDQYQMGGDGNYKTIQRSGIRIKFRPKGSIQLFDITTVMQSFTVAVVWIQIPLVIVYYFTVMCLGHLSSVYSRVINQELSLANACKGLAARLVSHSAAYMDLQDTPDGISKNRLSERFKKILDGRIRAGDLQPDEVENYVNYVFEGMQSMGDEVVINDSINIQEFCTACCTNEPLSFEQLVMLFDKDRKISCLESFFLDDTIRSVINESKKTLKDKEAGPESSQREEAILIDSVLKMKTCSDQVEELEGVCQKICRTATNELESQIDLAKRAAAIAAHRRAEGKSVIDPIHDFTPTEDPKPDQREEACSVADEEDPGKGYWNEV